MRCRGGVISIEVLDDPPSIELAAGIALGIVAGALYSAISAGLSTLGEARLVALRDEGGPLSKHADRAVRLGRPIRTRLLLGRVLSLGFATGCASLLGFRMSPLAGLAAAVVAALCYGLIAELATTVAQRRAPRAALQMLRWGRPLELLMVPVAAPIHALGALVASFVTPAKESNEIEARAVEHMIERGEERGTLQQDHAQLLLSVLDFKDTVVREVMVPRPKIEAFEIGTSLEEVLARVVEAGHSRYPVYRDQVDRIEGILYAKDLFRELNQAGRVRPDGSSPSISLKELVRTPVLFASEMQKIDAVLREMQQRRFHMAIVVDEFGGTGGLVTLEDILEEIVGEIEDEHDDAELPVAERAPGHYVADAAISVHDLAEFLGDPPLIGIHGNGSSDAPGDFDSLGGMMVQLAGRVPARGDEISTGGYDLRVLDGDERAVTRVEIVRRSVPLKVAQ